MDIRQYTKNDFIEFNQWRLAHRCTEVAEHELPQNGLVVIDGDLKIAMGFLLLTDTSRCIFVFPVVNPQVEKQKRDKGLDLLIKGIISWQKQSNYSSLYTWTNKSMQVKRLENNGFFQYSDSEIHLMRNL